MTADLRSSAENFDDPLLKEKLDKPDGKSDRLSTGTYNIDGSRVWVTVTFDSRICVRLHYNRPECATIGIAHPKPR